MGSLGPFEIALIFLAILLLFGAKRIPEIARGLGRGIREFKDATNDIKRELTVSDNPPPPQIQQPVQYHQPPAPPAQAAPPVQAPPADAAPDSSQSSS